MTTLCDELQGATYIRYGRTMCPTNGTELVYDGYFGGSDHQQSEGDVNFLCLPKDPIFDHYDDKGNSGTRLYGAEYELHGHNSNRFFPNTDLYEKDVPCAVCRTKRPSVLMVPAQNKCMDGWTLEYKGYLSAGHYCQSAASEFVCLDGEPEVLPGDGANNNGKLFYLVEAECGSLKSPPYYAYRELTCTVCSK